MSSDLEARVERLEKDLKKVKKEKKMIKKLLNHLFGGDGHSSQDNGKIDELQKELKDSKSKILNLSKNIEILKKGLLEKDKTIDNLRFEIDRLKSNSITQRIENLYSSLSNATKSGLENIFRGEDGLELFASASINFDSIWDYAKYLNQEHKDGDFRVLKEILEIVFEKIKNIKNYSTLEVENGDKFDMDTMIRDKRSLSQSGKVKEVILFGYKRRANIKQKSIVRI
jgi:hypothetical protein